MQDTIQKTTKKIQLNYPPNPFTIKDLEATHPNVSKVTIQNGVNTDLDIKLKKVGKKPGIGRGRHSILYQILGEN